jgi:hypothetical protein
MSDFSDRNPTRVTTQSLLNPFAKPFVPKTIKEKKHDDSFQFFSNVRTPLVNLKISRSKKNNEKIKTRRLANPDSKFKRAFSRSLKSRLNKLGRPLFQTEFQALIFAVRKQCDYHPRDASLPQSNGKKIKPSPFPVQFSSPPSPLTPPATPTPPPISPPPPPTLHQSSCCSKAANPCAFEIVHSEIARLRQIVFDTQDLILRNPLNSCSLPIGHKDNVVYEEKCEHEYAQASPGANFLTTVSHKRCPCHDHRELYQRKQYTTYPDITEFKLRAVQLNFTTDDFYVLPTSCVQNNFFALHPPRTETVTTIETKTVKTDRVWKLIPTTDAFALLKKDSPKHKLPSIMTDIYLKPTDQIFSLRNSDHPTEVRFLVQRRQAWLLVAPHTDEIQTKIRTPRVVQDEFIQKDHQDEISDLAYRSIRRSYLEFFSDSPVACSICTNKRRDYLFELHPILSSALTDDDLSLSKHWRRLIQDLGATCET